MYASEFDTISCDVPGPCRYNISNDVKTEEKQIWLENFNQIVHSHESVIYKITITVCQQYYKCTHRCI